MRDLKPRAPATGATDPDGVRVVSANPAGRRARRMYQLLGLLFASACAAYVLTPRTVAKPPPYGDRGQAPQTKHEIGAASAERPVMGMTGDASAPSAGRVAETAANTRPLTTKRKAPESEEPPLRPEDDPNEVASQLKHMGERAGEVTAAEYIQALHDAGIHEGIGAFNPPGTSPPLEGLAVPEDYALPEGYVRHYQTTDDGQDIEPILMYSPDFEFLDENGNPVAIPDDRVVRPEHAPPGFPIRPIEMPPKREPGDLSR